MEAQEHQTGGRSSSTLAFSLPVEYNVLRGVVLACLSRYQEIMIIRRAAMSTDLVLSQWPLFIGDSDCSCCQLFTERQTTLPFVLCQEVSRFLGASSNRRPFCLSTMS